MGDSWDDIEETEVEQSASVSFVMGQDILRLTGQRIVKAAHEPKYDGLFGYLLLAAFALPVCLMVWLFPGAPLWVYASVGSAQLALPFVLKWMEQIAVQRVIRNRAVLPKYLGAITCTISPQGIHVVTDTTWQLWSWYHIRNIEETPLIVYFLASDMSFIALPNAAFEDASQRVAYVALARKMHGARHDNSGVLLT